MIEKTQEKEYNFEIFKGKAKKALEVITTLIVMSFLFYIVGNSIIEYTYDLSAKNNPKGVPTLPMWEQFYAFNKIYPKTVDVNPDASCDGLFKTRRTDVLLFEEAMFKCLFDQLGLEKYGNSFSELDYKVMSSGRSYIDDSYTRIIFTEKAAKEKTYNNLFIEFHYTTSSSSEFGSYISYVDINTPGESSKGGNDEWTCTEKEYDRCMFDNWKVNEALFLYIDEIAPTIKEL